MGNWCPPRASNPLLRANPTLGGFDSHTFPPILQAEKPNAFLRCLYVCMTPPLPFASHHKHRDRDAGTPVARGDNDYGAPYRRRASRRRRDPEYVHLVIFGQPSDFNAFPCGLFAFCPS